MDSPGLDPVHHARALRGLARINFLSMAARRIRGRLLGLTPRNGSYRLLDVACGGGDVAMAAKSWAERKGINLQVQGCDVSPTAVEYARRRAEARGLQVEFFQLNALAEELPSGFDLVSSSLFLHHLTDDQAREFLPKLSKAGRVVLVQDLLRTHLGYLMAQVTVRVVSRSRVVWADGPQSVRAAFTLPEVGTLAREAGLVGSLVGRCWPERFCLHWETS